MDPQIPHDNKKLEEDDWISSSDVPIHPQTDLPVCVVNSSNNNWIDFPSSLINRLLGTAMEKVAKEMSIAGNSSSHTTYNEDFSRLPIDHVPFICAKKDNDANSTLNMFPHPDNNELDHVPFICAKKDKDAMNTTLNMFPHPDNNELDHVPFIGAKKDKVAMSITGNMFPHPDINELHMRKEIVQCLSSSVLSTDLFLGISYNIWSSVSSLIHVPPLHKEWDDHLSIWLSMLGLFGFMVFVCAVVVMILVRAPFTSMQKVMLVFSVILLHLQSVNSVSDVYVTLVGALLMVWYVFGKKKAPQYKEVI